MKLSNFLGLSLLATSVIAKSKISVYELSSKDSPSIQTVEEQDVLVYLGDRLGVSDFYKLGNHNENLIEFISERNELLEKSSFEKPKLIITVSGIDHPEKFFASKNPSFQIQDNSNRFTYDLFSKVPKQILSSRLNDLELNSLTKEIKLLSLKDDESSKLVQHFRLFNEKLLKIWDDFKVRSRKSHPHQIVLDENKVSDASVINLINDKMFINEFSQLVHLNAVSSDKNDFIFFNSNALLSIGKKIGFDSRTYQFSKRVLSDYLLELCKVYDLTVFSLSQDTIKENENVLAKRGSELNEVFENNDFSKRSSPSSCFTSEDSCQFSTSNCNNHGSCVKLNSKCWSCSCTPTYNTTTSKTTKWVGYDCNKKDVSMEANLFLWTTLSLVILFVGGVQLLSKVGAESLPGVLDTVTTQKKNA